MRPSRTRIVLAVAAVLTLLPLAAAPAMARDGARAEHDRIVKHWTSERIANAVPRDFAKSGLAGAGRPEGQAEAADEPAAAAASRARRGPRAARSSPRPARSCSRWTAATGSAPGTVVDDGGRPGYSMVLTAGHCAIDETNGTFATNWMFIPAFDTKPTYTCSASAYGCWTAVGLVGPQPVRHRGFVQQPGGRPTTGRSRSSGRAASPARTAARRDRRQLPDRVLRGGQGRQARRLRVPGRRQVPRQRPRLLRGRDRRGPGTSNLTWGMPCNMTGGSSGGPWLSGFTSRRGAAR